MYGSRIDKMPNVSAAIDLLFVFTTLYPSLYKIFSRTKGTVLLAFFLNEGMESATRTVPVVLTWCM